MSHINPKVIGALIESDKKGLEAIPVNGDNCIEMLQTMAIQHLARKSDAHATKNKKRFTRSRLLPA